MISLITSLYKSDRYLNKFSKQLKFFSAELKSKNIPFEIIAIANDPTEREKLFGKEFSGEPWFSFISVGRESVYATFNRGVSLAKGDKIGLWNSDDTRFAGALVEAEQLFARGAELIYFPFFIKRYLKLGSWYLPLPVMQKIDKQVPEFNAATSAEFKRNMNCGPFFLFTKTLYQKTGPFDEQFKIAGDFDWCARAAYQTQKFIKAKSLGGIFRVDGGGLSTGINPRRTAENNIVFMRNHALDKIGVADESIIKQYRPGHLLRAGNFSELLPLRQF